MEPVGERCLDACDRLRLRDLPNDAPETVVWEQRRTVVFSDAGCCLS